MFGALGERDFRLFFTGHAVSVLGDGMAPLALAFAVLDIGSASDHDAILPARAVRVDEEAKPPLIP